MLGNYRIMLGVTCVVALIAGLWVSQAVFRAPVPWDAWQKLGVYQARPVKAVAPFTLTDQNGQPFTNEHLLGAWHFVFVGYTFCPDVCPTTLSTFKTLSRVLDGAEMAVPARFIMLTADPERDTPERLKAYLAFFHPDFIGLSGTEELTRQVAQSLNAGFRVPEHAQDAPYFVDHSTHIALVNPEGQFAAFFQPPHEPALMQEVLIRLMEGE